MRCSSPANWSRRWRLDRPYRSDFAFCGAGAIARLFVLVQSATTCERPKHPWHKRRTPMPNDVLIIGAGAAGLSAALELSRAGLRVEIIEARDRVGGRMFTRHDPTLNHAVELGAEFVHGLAPEIWLPVQQRNLKVTEVEGDLWCSIDGKLQKCNFFAQADKILSVMEDEFVD